MRIKVLKFCILTSALFFSCTDYDAIEVVDIEPFSPAFGFPLFNSDASLKELIDATGDNINGYIEIEDDNLLIKYTDSVKHRPIIDIPDTLFVNTFAVQEDVHSVYENYTTFGSDSEIKYLYLKHGELVVEFIKDIPQHMDVSVTFPKLLDQANNPITADADWTSNNFISAHVFDLESHKFGLYRIDDGDTLFNKVKYDLEITAAGGAIGDLDINVSFNRMVSETAIGKLVTQDGIDEHGVNFGLFSKVIDGFIYIEDPLLEFDIGTSLGSPFSFIFDFIHFRDGEGNAIDLENTDKGSIGFRIGEPNYPHYASESDLFVTTNYFLDKNNSNLQDLLPFTPESMHLAGSYSMGDYDPSNEPSYYHGFFLNDTNHVYVNTLMELPLVNTIADLKFDIMTKIDSWPDPDELDNVLDDYEATLLIKARNGMPLEFLAQVQFLNSDGEVVDLLFDEGMRMIVESPDVDGTGDALGTEESITRITIDKERYERFMETTDAEVVFRARTLDAIDLDSRKVNIWPENSLGFQVSVEISAVVNPEPVDL